MLYFIVITDLFVTQRKMKCLSLPCGTEALCGRVVHVLQSVSVPMTLVRLLLGALLVLPVSIGAFAAPVPTERITAPQSLEPAPGLSAPSEALEAGEEDNEKPAEETAAEPPLPEIFYGEKELPDAVRQMRADLLEAARNVDFRRLRLIYDANDPRPVLSFGDVDDPIDFLKQSSGDGEGLEILAILVEVLEAGWVRKNPDTPEEMYVWPYFTELPLASLTDKQKVELFEIVTAVDYDEMESYGSYIFYRIGIGPDGNWYYFVAGD